MNEEEFYRQKALKQGSQKGSSTSASTANHDQSNARKKQYLAKRPYGNNVGKDGGNPEYKKTVI